MKKQFLIITFLSFTLLQFCTTTKKVTQQQAPATITTSYQKDISPIMQMHCTPCHFPEQGKKKMLDTYAATRDNFDDIITRVQLPADDIKFMPFKSKKPPLSDSLINVLKQWRREGMPE